MADIDESWERCEQAINRHFPGRPEIAQKVVLELRTILDLEDMVWQCVDKVLLALFVQEVFRRQLFASAVKEILPRLRQEVQRVSDSQEKDPGREMRVRIYNELMRFSIEIGFKAMRYPVSYTLCPVNGCIIVYMIASKDFAVDGLPAKADEFRIEYRTELEVKGTAEEEEQQANGRLLDRIKELGGTKGGKGIEVGFKEGVFLVELGEEVDLSLLPHEYEGCPVRYSHDPPTIG